MQQTLTEKLPAYLANDFKGYFHKVHPTVLPFNVLTYPSINCSIPMFDQIVPDLGKLLLGQPFTENSGIIGNKEKFKNLGGVEMEVRVWRSLLTPAKGDVIEVLYNGLWHQITENINPYPVSSHEYYFDEYWDSNLNPALSRNLPRLVWVNGFYDMYYDRGEIYSWTGGITTIQQVTIVGPNSELVTPGGVTWRSLGFTEIKNGNAYIIVDGVSHELVNPAELDTDTIEVMGIVTGTIASQIIEVDYSPIGFDMCRQNKGYMFYGNWNYRQLYMSNAFNRPDKIYVTSFAGVNNDLILQDTSHYTGTKESVFHITIDSVAPNEQVFVGTGNNTGSFDTSGYSLTGTHTFKLSFVADLNIRYVGGTGGFTVGEVIQGATANDLAQIMWDDTTNQRLACIYISGVFAVGDTVTGLDSGVSETITNTYFIGFYQFFMDGQLFSQPSGTASELFLGTNLFIGTGLSMTFETVTGFHVGDYYELKIGSADTFAWQKDDGAQTSNVFITGNYQTLSDGVRIKFINKRGHTLGDTWDVTAIPEVTRSWADFYYALPVRRPGEGYIFKDLTSNFWTMDTQEEQLYVNTSYGRWVLIDTILSSDLQSESVTATPLKSAGANKVIYPYMTGHMENMLVYVTEDHNLDYIGRQKLLEKPQIDTLSDPVELDFQAASFVGGRIKYLDKKLYITSPENGLMFCYDKLHEYWHPPKSFPENAILSIVGNDLITHSNTRNQSFTMFASPSDNGLAYTVKIRSPYTSAGDRWKSKASNMSFVEGQIQGNPELIHTVYLDVNGCKGIYSHTIEPIICVNPNDAPLGDGVFGGHPFGSPISPDNSSYFQEIYTKYQKQLDYHFLAVEISCTSKAHTYSILSYGMNGIWSTSGNNELVNKGSILP